MEAADVLKLFTTASNVAHGICFTLREVAWRWLDRLLADKSGATAVEYGLIVAGISIAIIGIVFTIGNDISAYFVAIDSKLSSKTPT